MEIQKAKLPLQGTLKSDKPFVFVESFFVEIPDKNIFSFLKILLPDKLLFVLLHNIIVTTSFYDPLSAYYLLYIFLKIQIN